MNTTNRMVNDRNSSASVFCSKCNLRKMSTCFLTVFFFLPRALKGSSMTLTQQNLQSQQSMWLSHESRLFPKNHQHQFLLTMNEVFPNKSSKLNNKMLFLWEPSGKTHKSLFWVWCPHQQDGIICLCLPKAFQIITKKLIDFNQFYDERTWFSMFGLKYFTSVRGVSHIPKSNFIFIYVFFFFFFLIPDEPPNMLHSRKLRGWRK